MPETKYVDLFMIINKIVALSWCLSSFSYMMHGHTFIRFAYYIVYMAVTPPFRYRKNTLKHVTIASSVLPKCSSEKYFYFYLTGDFITLR
jgi:hypothetical protein